MRSTKPYALIDVPLIAATSLMLALSLALISCAEEDISKEKSGPEVRTYYIAADPVDWDYAPHGVNDISGAPFDD